MGTRTRTAAAAAGVAALALGASGLAAVPATADPAPAGSLVMIGGNLKEDSRILQRIVDLADEAQGADGPPTIAIITAAASPAKNPGKGRHDRFNNAQANGVYYSGLFAQYGADTYAVPIDERIDWKKDPYVPANADDPDVAARVAKADGVFFGGGDQMRYVRTLMDCAPAEDEAFTTCNDTPVLAAVREVLNKGGVVAGVSAGTTIQQGADMVTGGESYQGWRDGAQAGYFDDATKLAYLPAGGFGFFTAGLVDSHFTTWGRQARMIRLALDTGHPRVFGVDETTALVVDRADNSAEVIGDHGVSVLDVSAADPAGGTTASGVRWTYLVAGDSIDLGSGTVNPDARPLTGQGVGPRPVADVWDSIDGLGNVYTLRDLARDLVASGAESATGTTYETDPQFSTTVAVDGETKAWEGGAGIGFEDLEVSIEPKQ